MRPSASSGSVPILASFSPRGEVEDRFDRYSVDDHRRSVLFGDLGRAIMKASCKDDHLAAGFLVHRDEDFEVPASKDVQPPLAERRLTK